MNSAIVPRPFHRTRMMAIWRSAGWPCRDAVELDLVGAGWATLAKDGNGHETIRLTDLGIQLLAGFRRRNLRSLSAHDQLAGRVAADLMAAGRVVWRELSLRARVNDSRPALVGPTLSTEALWQDDQPDSTPPDPSQVPNGSWRMARPDVFSVRSTSVERHLQPIVHEVKVSRADLLSDLRHAAKRDSYRWLSCETFYVLPTDVAEPQEIPEEFGVWLLKGPIESGVLELARPAKHTPCKLPFQVWMALAKATPLRFDSEPSQLELGAASEQDAADAEPAMHVRLHQAWTPSGP